MSFREATRSYGPVERVAVSSASAQSAVVATGEVMLHASTACFVMVGSNPTVTTSTGIPLVAGEKFHMRIVPGYKVAVIRDSVDGYLYVSACT